MLKTTAMLLLGLLLLTACGDDAEDVSLSDDATLGTLDYEDQMALCDELIAIAPPSCWTAENRWVYGKLRAEDGVPSTEMQMCLAALQAHDGGVSVVEMKVCYEGADEESCEIDDESCGPVTPVNTNEDEGGVVYGPCTDNCDDPTCLENISKCTQDLSCDLWDKPTVCYLICCPPAP